MPVVALPALPHHSITIAQRRTKTLLLLGRQTADSADRIFLERLKRFNWIDGDDLPLDRLANHGLQGGDVTIDRGRLLSILSSLTAPGFELPDSQRAQRL